MKPIVLASQLSTCLPFAAHQDAFRSKGPQLLTVADALTWVYARAKLGVKRKRVLSTVCATQKAGGRLGPARKSAGCGTNHSIINGLSAVSPPRRRDPVPFRSSVIHAAENRRCR